MNPLTESTEGDSRSPVNNIPPLTHQEEEKFTMIMKQVEQGAFEKMTPENIKQVLKRRETVDSYIHDERMQVHERYKINQ